MNVSDAISDFVVTTSSQSIPPIARERAVTAMLDNYALAYAGTPAIMSSAFVKSTEAWRAQGPCYVVGIDSGVDPCTAALLNGAAMHAQDYDAMNYAVFGFTGSAITASLAAYSEVQTGLTGRDIVDAFCLGWEVSSALGRGLNPTHYWKGWHPTATLGLFAATSSLCKVMGLDREQTKAALSIAVSEASGIKIIVGNMINPYHVGKAARNAVVAATFARNGVAGHSDPFGARWGFLNVFQAPGEYDPARIVNTLGNPWDLEQPGAAFKIHPCCGLIHSGMDAIHALKSEAGVTWQDISGLHVKLHEFVPEVMMIGVPETGYQGKFSIRYCLALALVHDEVRIAHFDKVDPKIVELSRMITYEVHPELRGGETVWDPEFTDVEMRVDDAILNRRVARRDNRGVGATTASAEMRAKFEDCLGTAAKYGLGSGREVHADWSRLAVMDSDEPWDFWGRPTLTAAHKGAKSKERS